MERRATSIDMLNQLWDWLHLISIRQNGCLACDQRIVTLLIYNRLRNWTSCLSEHHRILSADKIKIEIKIKKHTHYFPLSISRNERKDIIICEWNWIENPNSNRCFQSVAMEEREKKNWEKNQRQAKTLCRLSPALISHTQITKWYLIKRKKKKKEEKKVRKQHQAKHKTKAWRENNQIENGTIVTVCWFVWRFVRWRMYQLGLCCAVCRPSALAKMKVKHINDRWQFASLWPLLPISVVIYINRWLPHANMLIYLSASDERNKWPHQKSFSDIRKWAELQHGARLLQCTNDKFWRWF